MSGDKTVGQWAGAIAGAVVGAYVGGPAGALQGAAWGAGIGGVIDPPKGPSIKGPRLQDSTVQGVQYGAPLLRGYGRFASVGTVIYLENNELKETITKKKQGGKGGGGGSSTVTTYTYSATFGVALADMPPEGIKAVGKVWVGSDLIYDGESDDLETIVASRKATSGTDYQLGLSLSDGNYPITGNNGVKFHIYPGTDDQQPDSRIEAELGSGNAPAFRGTCYIMFYDLPLKKYGNSLMGAQVKVELIAGDVVSTGTPHITTVNAKGPVANAADYTGCLSPLNPDASSTVSARSSGNNSQKNKITSSGALVVTELNDIGSPMDGWADVDSWAGVKADGTINLNNSTLPGEYIGVSNRYLHRYGGVIVSFYTKSLSHIYAKLYGDSTAGPTELPDIYVAAIVDESLIAGIHDDGLTITLFNTSDLSVNDSFTLSSVWPSSLTLSVLTTPRNTWACVDNGIFYVYSAAQKKLLVVDLEAKAEVDRRDITDVFYNSTAGGTISVKYGILSIFENGTSLVSPSRVQHYNLTGFSESGVTLASVVEDELTRAELISSSDINVTDLASDTVRGFRVSGVQQVRSCIGPLQAAWPFDLIMDGYQIKAVRRGNSSVRTLTQDDLDARPFGDPAGVQLKQAREMDSQLPKKILLKYIDVNREHEINQQSSVERQSSGAVQLQEVELPIVFSPNEAAAAADVMFNMAWTERTDYQFNLSPEHIDLQPADVVTITTDYGSFEIILKDTNYLTDGRLECSGCATAAANYTQSGSVGDAGSVPSATIPLAGDALAILMDIPCIRNQDDEAAFAVAMAGYASSWPGGVLYQSIDNEQTWQPLQAWAAGVTMGYASNTLPAHDGRVIDRTNTLTIFLIEGALDAITEAQMMTGLNWAAYGVHGRWELIRFADVTLNSNGSYTISTLIRGAKGTEQYTGTHQTSDIFVLLDDADIYGIGVDLQYLSISRKYRALTTGQEIDEAESQDFAYTGVNLKPLSGVNGTLINNAGVWEINWNYRTRLNGSLWTTGTPLPTGEDIIAGNNLTFEIDILDTASPANVVRTITVTGPTAEYTIAQQEEDFGSPIPTSLTVKVYQLSATVGRGYPLEISA